MPDDRAGNVQRVGGARLSLACLIAIWALAIPFQAQTFHLIHTFVGGNDAYPYAGVTLDAGGNLYGTTSGRAWGGVYQLKRHGSDWIFNFLYTFQTEDGHNPTAGVVFGPDGALYGTTQYGGLHCAGAGCGIVFRLQPPARVCGNASCPWTEHIVHAFGVQIGDGFHPGRGALTFDSAGNIYGTTNDGGTTFDGTVFEITKTQGIYQEQVIFTFPGSAGRPDAGVTFNSAGNLFGTTTTNNGSVYEMSFDGHSWTQHTIYAFQGGSDGYYPRANLIFDAAGNAYGTTEGGGTQRATVFQLSPQIDGTWRETVLHVFEPGGYGPQGYLAMDAAGNLYGSTYGLGGPYRFGFVFKLTYSQGSWNFSHVYDFQNGDDGAYPIGGVTVDAAGNLYGTCVEGGSHGYGTVWEITP